MEKNGAKNSFIFYYSYEEQIKMLSGEEVKELVLAMINYDKNNEIPNFSGILKMAFSFIKTNLDIDLDKYKKICERNQINGLKGGRPKNPKNPSGYLEKPKKPKKPKKPDNDNDNDNDNDIDNDIDIDNIYNFIEKNFSRTLSPIEYEEISSWEDNDLTRYAIKQSVLSGKCNIKYISRILDNYKKNSITTIQQAQNEEEKFKNKNFNNTEETKTAYEKRQEIYRKLEEKYK